ncbi:ankyrin repeat domain-containing protein [Pseudoduganella sp. DS3]|uniref:Ankyrin repeat domain-containing protein n=1 Tax=Pseudoduganella guangdongensis TaxID=2692179 RepID=A0A6N9HMI6_9BURK|nr:ankyrin repeat domain-containing protein [Pseudoduganella guangdongensis]MYN03905.1 ankyrin repeat domain-containing protein [Pseudoduganella guangdongensis]
MPAHRRAALQRCAALALLALAAPWTPARADSPTAEEDAVRYFLAIQLDDDRTVRAVLARGLDPNTSDPERGESGLIIAMRYDAMKVAQLLLTQPALRVDQAAPNGNTALMMAAFQKNKPAVLALLAKGAQINRPGWTALHYAAAAGALDIMQLLLERHAYLDAESPSGMTPLMLAAREGMEDAVQLLLQAGADASLKDRAWGMDAAGFATRADKPWIAQAIQRHLGKK